MTTRKTLLIVTLEDRLDEHDAVHVYYAEHSLEHYLDFEGALARAFSAWAKTEEGKAFVTKKGWNWGDALDVPQDFLRAQGIVHYEYRWPVPKCDDTLVVRHCEPVGACTRLALERW